MICFRCGSNKIELTGRTSEGDPKFCCQLCGRKFKIKAENFYGDDDLFESETMDDDLFEPDTDDDLFEPEATDEMNEESSERQTAIEWRATGQSRIGGTTVKCVNCGSSNVVKNGKSGTGKQKYRCKSCGRTFQSDLSSRSKRGSRQNRATATRTSQKSKGIAIVLACFGFVGLGGLNRFYVGKNVSGVVYLCTVGLCLVGTIYDIIQLKNGNFTDKDGLPLR